MNDNAEILVNDEAPHVDLLLEEYKQAGVMPNGWYDIATNQEKRRMIWAGQSPDGRRWDENMPEGQPAMPWDGSSDTRVPMVDGVCNDDTAVLKTAFRKAELRANATDPDKADLASGLSTYLHWLTHVKLRRMLRLESELSAQYSREHGWCTCYVGWEREVAKRRTTVTLEQVEQWVTMLLQQQQEQTPNSNTQAPVQTPGQAGQDRSLVTSAATWGGYMQALMDPSQEDAAVEGWRDLYKQYVVATFTQQGFFEEEQEKLAEVSVAAARKAVRALREEGKAEIAVPYVCKNRPLAWVLTPYLEFLAARGTMMLQQARVVFWRRWFSEAELDAKKQEGWDPLWIEEVKKTKGNISSWAGALGATSLTGPSTKTVGNTTFLKVTEENNPLIEAVYAFVKKVDEDGVTGVWQTIFSPHLTREPGGTVDFCAKHELLDYAHGQYPFVELKRENIGRALTDTRSVAEVSGTWQDEEKNQRDLLFNRAQWETLPPVAVPKLGGVDYRLGPGAQVPVSRGQDIRALELGGVTSPTLSLELIKLLRLQSAEYFGQFNPEVDPAKVAAKQGNAADDFYSFWGEVLLQMFALTLQYNPQEIVRVTGMPELGGLDPYTVLEQFDAGLEFDVMELNPDFLVKKMEAINTQVVPGDVGGVIDRAALTTLQLRMVDPRLARMVAQDKSGASQKVFREVSDQVMAMALGNEAEYTENDPAAGMKLQFLQNIVGSNPKYQKWLQGDKRFQALMDNYQKNLKMSVMQQQNKQVGRLGVKPVGAA